VLIINPFSPEAERIVKKHQVEGISRKEIFYFAKRLVNWKASGGKKKIIPKAILTGYDGERDVLSQRLLLLTTALHFTPYSNELRLVKDAIQFLTKARLSALDLSDENLIIGLLSDMLDIKIGSPTVEGGMRFGEVFVERGELFAGDQLRYGEPWKIKYATNWRELIKLIRARDIRFTDLYLVEGLALLSLNDMIEYYSKLIAINIEDYINTRFDEFQGRRNSKEVKQLIEHTAELGEFLSHIAGESYKSNVLLGKAGRLQLSNFPPCIKNIIVGVQTGSRNYAISVLLTSFLSYARVAPRKVQNPRISDYISDPKVLSDEILPLIFEAAVRCTPPLFQDQPGEKLNINYHLGLGLNSQVKLENSGSSHWYFPPNCEKIRRESPGLCKPDETCSRIKNPLTYYFSKFKKERT
jgi:DNA primase large subunit